LKLHIEHGNFWKLFFIKLCFQKLATRKRIQKKNFKIHRLKRKIQQDGTKIKIATKKITDSNIKLILHKINVLP